MYQSLIYQGSKLAFNYRIILLNIWWQNFSFFLQDVRNYIGACIWTETLWSKETLSALQKLCYFLPYLCQWFSTDSYMKPRFLSLCINRIYVTFTYNFFIIFIVNIVLLCLCKIHVIYGTSSIIIKNKIQQTLNFLGIMFHYLLHISWISSTSI